MNLDEEELSHAGVSKQSHTKKNSPAVDINRSSTNATQ